MTDDALARELAEAAGALLMGIRRAGVLRNAALGAAGDRIANSFILDALASARPDDAILSEEEKDHPARLAASRVWILDPLDGTREYGLAGRSDWAVHVALWEDGAFTAGAVSLPALGATYATDPPPEVPLVKRSRPVVVTSRSRSSYITAVAAGAIGADVISMGSAGAKAMAVVSGIADVYVHAGGMYQWDSAAPAAVALAAGLHVSRIDGSPVAYNDPDPWLPDFVVCRTPFAEPILRAIDAAWREWQGSHGA